jgi:hypothetical protein
MPSMSVMAFNRPGLEGDAQVTGTLKLFCLKAEI